MFKKITLLRFTLHIVQDTAQMQKVGRERHVCVEQIQHMLNRGDIDIHFPVSRNLTFLV